MPGAGRVSRGPGALYFRAMVNTASQMLPLGTKMPAFALPDGAGTEHTSAGLAGESGTLVAFICNHCPFVKHIRAQLAALGRELPAKGIGMVAINSNDFAKYPDDSPARMLDEVAQQGYDFAYLIDEDQSLAKAFRAACTPDFYLFDRDGTLVYRGQLDGARPGNDAPVDGADLRAAIDALVAGEEIAAEQRASIGCNIKWKPGNEPEWFG